MTQREVPEALAKEWHLEEGEHVLWFAGDGEPCEAQRPTRAEVLQAYPNARWFQHDIPPPGLRVRRLDHPERDVGTVVGVIPEAAYAHHCDTCQCVERALCAGWWEVQIDGYYGRPGRYFVKRDQPRPGEVPLIILAYPPTLEPLGETVNKELGDASDHSAC